MIDKTLCLLVFSTATMGLMRTSVVGVEALPPRALARIGDHRFYHGPGIECVAWSADGSRIASAAHYLPYFTHISDNERKAYDTLIVVWDAATGARLGERHVPYGRVWHLALSADGKRLAAAYSRHSNTKAGIVVFETASGKTLWRLDDSSLEGVGPLQFSTDGKQLYGSGSLVKVWEAATGKQLRRCKPSKTLDNGARACWGMLSPDGKVIVWEWRRESHGATVSVGLRVHDADTDKRLSQINLKPDDRGLESITFSADSKRFAAYCGTKLLVWETATGKELAALHVSGVVRFALSPDGRRAAVNEGSYRLRLWDLHNGKPSRDLYAGREAMTPAFEEPPLVFSADGKTLLVPTSTLRFFDTRSEKERAAPGHRAAIVPRFSGDGRTLFTACAEARGRWDLSRINEPALLRYEPLHAWEIERLFALLAASADDQLFLDTSKDRVRIRETATGRVLRVLDDDSDRTSVYGWFSPDAQRVLLRSGYEYIPPRPDMFRLYDVKTGKKTGEFKTELKGHRVLSRNGRLVACVTGDGVVHLHDAATGKSVRTLRSSRPHLESEGDNARLVFSADGEQLIVATHRYDARKPEGEQHIALPVSVFQLCSGREMFRFYVNPEKTNRAARLSCLACSPDGRLLAVAEDYCGVVRVLELASGKVRVEFAGHRHGVRGLAFAPDGKTLASGGEDNVVFLWDVTGAKTPAANKASDNDLTALWDDLASADGQRAGVAIASCLRKPAASVAFLQERLH
ncbi:MAG: WD40 repeat domain-containing protein, partial [Gemmataceae bacterium]